MQLPTITIKDDNRRGWKIINRSDFDPAKHEVFGGAPGAAPVPQQFTANGEPSEAPAEEAAVAKLTRSQVYRMTKPELVENLEALGHPAVGNAADLKDRLISALDI